MQMNLDSIIKPYYYEVWILILISIPTVVASLYCLSRFVASKITSLARVGHFNSLERAIDYTLGVFCSQGIK